MAAGVNATNNHGVQLLFGNTVAQFIANNPHRCAIHINFNFARRLGAISKIKGSQVNGEVIALAVIAARLIHQAATAVANFGQLRFELIGSENRTCCQYQRPSVNLSRLLVALPIECTTHLGVAVGEKYDHEH